MERKQYKRFSREFKLETVRLAAVGERPKAQSARELGIRVNQLRKWRLDFEAKEQTGAPKRPPVTDDERQQQSVFGQSNYDRISC
ncbi:MAG: transposase, partial [Betaproteobacteria bacterium]